MKLDKVKRIALGADAGLMRGAARALGYPDAACDALWSEIGDCGAASAPLALAAASPLPFAFGAFASSITTTV